MTCPSCNSPLEPNARFCGVCGHRQAPNRAAITAPGPGGPGSPAVLDRAVIAAKQSPAPAPRRPLTPLPVAPSPSPSPSSSPRPAGSKADIGKAVLTPPQKQAARPPTKRPAPKTGDEIYINQVLNNRFKVESKIGEGGFGAVYRGVQLATGRKVALKLLHPEMTKDENLVARFRREGMVLCNLRDAHTITTYDFDQTPDGTLYIAMELLEGKSLHQLFHEAAPLEWKRVFKILTEMCSSLAEAHAQGIVHRDLKPENIYLESRSGNPEFVKILDFGIAKVMRGESIDPQSPQLTATGQTLGTLEYMSPEQLMGKPLDGRSDVYALGVLAYEMITGRLPFPDAKGPAGLITAQLKQTPQPPSAAYPKAGLPEDADRVILKCLEKDKNNRFPDVSALAAALQEAITAQNNELAVLKHIPIPQSRPAQSSVDMLETRRGELPTNLPLPPMSLPIPPTPAPSALPPAVAMPHARMQSPALNTPSSGSPHAHGGTTAGHASGHGAHGGTTAGHAGGHGAHDDSRGHRQAPMSYPAPMAPIATPMAPPVAPAHYARPPAPRSSSKLIWWVLALLAIGAGVGTVVALLVSR